MHSRTLETLFDLDSAVTVASVYIVDKIAVPRTTIDGHRQQERDNNKLIVIAFCKCGLPLNTIVSEFMSCYMAHRIILHFSEEAYQRLTKYK